MAAMHAALVPPTNIHESMPAQASGILPIPSDSKKKLASTGKVAGKGRGLISPLLSSLLFFPLERTKLSAQLFISKFIAV